MRSGGGPYVQDHREPERAMGFDTAFSGFRIIGVADAASVAVLAATKAVSAFSM